MGTTVLVSVAAVVCAAAIVWFGIALVRSGALADEQREEQLYIKSWPGRKD